MNYVGLLLFLVVCPSSGFLLNDRTTPVPDIINGILEERFNALVTLVSAESNARIKLEKRVAHLEKELLLTQQGLTEVYNENQRLNDSMAYQSRIMASLTSEIAAFKSKYDILERLNKEIAINFTIAETELNSVKNKVSQLEQMKPFSELQLVLDIRNDTQHLQDELKSTNSKLDHVLNENNARKDDIIALYNQVSNNENKLMSYAKNISEAINRTSHQIVENLSKNINDLSQHQNQTAKQLTQKIVYLNHALNVTSSMVDSEIHNMSGRAILTSSAAQQTYSSGSKIHFPDVKTRYGVSDSVISELGTTGNYRVESSGVYLISPYIMTEAAGNYDVIVNNRVVANSHFYTGTSYKTAAITFSTRLETNDLLYIKVKTDMLIYGNQYSCLTILQLTVD